MMMMIAANYRVRKEGKERGGERGELNNLRGGGGGVGHIYMSSSNN